MSGRLNAIQWRPSRPRPADPAYSLLTSTFIAVISSGRLP